MLVTGECEFLSFLMLHWLTFRHLKSCLWLKSNITLIWCSSKCNLTFCFRSEEVLPTQRFIQKKGNTTVYEWKTGNVPTLVERPVMEEAPPDVVVEETVSVIIWLHELSFKSLSVIYLSFLFCTDWLGWPRWWCWYWKCGFWDLCWGWCGLGY